MAQVTDRVFKHLIVAAFGAHWLACGWVYIARRNEAEGLPSYLSSETELKFFQVCFTFLYF